MGPITTRKLSDLKTNLLDVRELAERGTIVYLTYHGRPRCALVPLEAARRLEAATYSPETTTK